MHLPVFGGLNAIPVAFEAALITDLASTQATYDAAVNTLGRERGRLPELLRRVTDPHKVQH